MRQEFKWYLTIQLDVDEEQVGSDCSERLYDEAKYAMNQAMDRFFDTLNSNENIASWKVIDEETK